MNLQDEISSFLERTAVFPPRYNIKNWYSEQNPVFPINYIELCNIPEPVLGMLKADSEFSDIWNHIEDTPKQYYFQHLLIDPDFKTVGNSNWKHEHYHALPKRFPEPETVKPTAYLNSFTDHFFKCFPNIVKAVYYKMEPGCIVRPHLDAESHKYAICHVPLSGGDETEYYCWGEKFKFYAGKYYYLNAGLTHAVYHPITAKENRINLLVVQKLDKPVTEQLLENVNNIKAFCKSYVK